MPRLYAPSWKTGEPVSLPNMSDQTIPACRAVFLIFRRSAGGVMLPFAVGSPLPADDEYDLDRATFGGVSKTPVGPGELGAFYGRSGDVVVFETSGPCSTGRAIRCYDGTGRVQTTDEPWRVENNGFHVPGYVLHDAGAGEYVEVLLA